MDDLNSWRFLEAGGKLLLLEDAPLVVRGVACWSGCNDEARAFPPVPALLAALAWDMSSIAFCVSSFSATLVDIWIRLLDRRVGDGPGGPLEEACWLAGGGAVMDSLVVAAFLRPLEATAAAYDCDAAPVEAPAACLADADALTLVGLGLPVEVLAAVGSSGRAASGLATPRLSRTVGRPL